MKTRLNRITTKTGDAGETSLADGARLSKADERVEAIGAVDELNAALGVLKAHLLERVTGDADSNKAMAQQLHQVQNELFNLGGELALPNALLVKEDALVALERYAKDWNKELPALTEFVIPGQCSVSAFAHLARCVARRVERNLVRLSQSDALNPMTIAYLNRLSDYLFIISREIARQIENNEPQWQRQ